MIETGTLLQDRYLIERQIGAGGMGAVYRAIDRRFGSHVAIKETFYKDVELGNAFEREAHLLNSLHHPVLPHVSDYFTESNGHFLVMQFIEGEDLFEILKRKGAFPVADVLRWTNSLLNALDYLHSQTPPIIHRDIKPQNLKITTRGDIVLLDFGLAKFSSDDTQAQLSVFGYSRKYSPLEQIQGTGTDARSDIFALGATVYHLLTGKPPIDVLARAAEIVAGNRDPLRPANEINDQIPLDVANVLNSALALNAAGRFVSAIAMQQALEHTVNVDSAENAEELPETVLAAVPFDNGVIISTETESFPALEAFAAEVASNSPQTDVNDKLAAVEISNQNRQTPLTIPEVLPHTTTVLEEATRVSPHVKRSRFPIAALAAVLICVGLSAGYFINKANSSNEPEQTPIVQSTSAESDSKPEESATVLDTPMPEVSDSSSEEKAVQTEAAPTLVKTSAEKREIPEKRETAEKRKTIDEPSVQVETTQVETIEKPKPASAPVETSRPTPKQIPRRSESQRDGETRSRVIEAPVPDIESIFTGRPSGQRDDKLRRQEERPRQREQMSDEELKEMRRQRKEERRRRQNGNNFPF